MKVELTEDLFLGRGAHKAAYVHPEDERLCVKIPFKWPDEDIKKEIRYRSVLGQKAAGMSLLVKYYGTVETNMGRGFLFERVMDFDGAECINLKQYLEAGPSSEDLLRLMLDFREEFFRGRYVVAGMNPDNFLVQRISQTERRIRIVDDLGTGAFIPVLYYFDRLLLKRAAKYWRLLVHQLEAGYGGIITHEIAVRLMEGIASMRVCLFSERTERMAWLGDCLAGMGNRVTLMTTARNCRKEVGVDSIPQRMKILHLHKALGWFECFARFTSIAWKTDSLLLDGIPGFAVPAVLLARLFDKPVLALVSENDLQAIVQSPFGLAGRLLRMCEYVVAGNEHVKQRIISKYGFKDRKVIVLPYETCNGESGEAKVSPQLVRQLQSLLNGDN